MREQFKINSADYIRIQHDHLREVVFEIFKKIGVSENDARVATDALVSADLRGIESHGVSNMLKKYIRDYRSEKLNPTPQWKIVRETQSTASIDGDGGLGLIIATEAMEIAIKKAKDVGVGIVTMRNVGHMGAASHYAMMPLAHNMIGVAMTATPPEVIPTFGSETRLGTNPIALAAPGYHNGPFVYDASTSVVSNNKLSLARRLGVKLPAGWIADADGNPIMNETEPPPDIRSHANLLPLGSTPELGSHKGYGLACMVDILSGILTGGGYGAMVGRVGYTHYVAAYDIEAFMDTTEFKQTMDEWLDVLNATKPALGHERVFYPGQIEAEYEEAYLKNGIPLHKDVIAWLHSLCEELSISCTL